MLTVSVLRFVLFFTFHGLLALEVDSIKNVHLIFMNHLDVGYNSYPKTGFINTVLNGYFDDYFPHAANLGKELEDKGYVETFKYTTHPWLVSLFLDCPPNFILSGIKLNCPNDAQKTQFIEAVKKGYITWHAGPMNMQMELMPSFLVKFGLNMSQSLDERFNISRTFRTLSQRDVPGMTQTMIPLLLENNIVAISVGVNGRTAPPAVPGAFRWYYRGQSVLALWLPGGYPRPPGPDPKHPGGLGIEHCHIVPGMSDVLCFAFNNDNQGPPKDIQQIFNDYEIMRAQFPHANIKASTFEAYVEKLWHHKHHLPSIKNEIGDTWIQGHQSDPYKSSSFKAISRVFEKCLQKNICFYSDSRFWNATRFLLKLGEHTAGLAWRGDHINWSNEAFYKVINSPHYVDTVKAWISQRKFGNLAIEALGDHPIATEILQELKKLRLPANKPDLTKFKSYASNDYNRHVCSENVTIGFSSSGAINYLTHKLNFFASSSHTLAQFIYSTYNQSDFQRAGSAYNYETFGPGIIKRNLTMNSKCESKFWIPEVIGFYKHSSDKCNFWLESILPNKTFQYYGAPTSIWMHVKMNRYENFDIEIALYNKTLTRLPESSSMMWNPIPSVHNKWILNKISKPIDPKKVHLNGSQYQHSAESVIFKRKDYEKNGMSIVGIDTSLVAILTDEFPKPNIFPAPIKPINGTITGVAHNIHNNLWSTNFILWYPYLSDDRNLLSRFCLNFF